MSKIPITVIITTKNEAARIERCIAALRDFDQIIVVDSLSTDDTAHLAKEASAQVIQFEWNGRYPKKRQWCLNNLGAMFLNEWIFFVDADEIVTPKLTAELKSMNWQATDKVAGYFIKGRYIMNGQPLRFGMMNNKLALIHRDKMKFPVVDDLDIPGMGEIEGHYQPILKDIYAGHHIESIKTPLLHDACDNRAAWLVRHERYAQWERGMDEKNAWPIEDTPSRARAKAFFRSLPPWGRALVAFMHSFVLKLGFLDGLNGFTFAKMRADYYARR